MTSRLFVGLLIMVFFHAIGIESYSQDNNPPVVKILDPKNKSSFPLNSSVPYRIKVSDKEDGESEYGEIAANEVFLEVRYLPGIFDPTMTSTPDATGLASIKKSNCFTCHAFNGKLIAPSFYEIANRYAANPSTIELIANRIRKGSGGVWGNASMPSHDDLSDQEAKEIVNWILKNGKDLNLNYYAGIEGIFKTKTPDGATQKGTFLLSATYTDHGNNMQRRTSKDVIVVIIK